MRVIRRLAAAERLFRPQLYCSSF